MVGICASGERRFAMTKFVNFNLKVVLLDSDFYAQQAINGFLAWDRRTRVAHIAESQAALWDYLKRVPLAEQPDVVLLDADHMGGSETLEATIKQLRHEIKDVVVICLAQFLDLRLVNAAANAGARAYFLKSEARQQIAWGIVYAMQHDFVITPGLLRATDDGHELLSGRVLHAKQLAKPREFPLLTHRVRQALELSVTKGMPAQLISDEMGISLHTVRSYIKEGYRKLEDVDNHEYPNDMPPQELAFMRLTRPDDEAED
jgi:DNA-binding NarL/FixJ family response regulator